MLTSLSVTSGSKVSHGFVPGTCIGQVQLQHDDLLSAHFSLRTRFMARGVLCSFLDRCRVEAEGVLCHLLVFKIMTVTIAQQH